MDLWSQSLLIYIYCYQLQLDIISLIHVGIGRKSCIKYIVLHLYEMLQYVWWIWLTYVYIIKQFFIISLYSLCLCRTIQHRSTFSGYFKNKITDIFELPVEYLWVMRQWIPGEKNLRKALTRWPNRLFLTIFIEDDRILYDWGAVNFHNGFTLPNLASLYIEPKDILINK